MPSTQGDDDRATDSTNAITKGERCGETDPESALYPHERLSPMATVIETPKATTGTKPKQELPKDKARRALKPSIGMPKKKANSGVKPKEALPSLVAEIRELQRQRVTTQKSRIMIDNRLTATVATASGYHAGMEEDERGKRFGDAKKLIREVQGDSKVETDVVHALAPLIEACSVSIDGFHATEKAYEKEMEKLAKQLPVAKWMALTDQRGFGWLSLAIIIGESGDLSNYANPGKLWRRMGCAPVESKGKTFMPSTWRSRKKHNGGLSAAEWEEAGYCPRRRSVMFVISESLMKGNGAREATETRKALPIGPYARRYATKKAEAIARKDPEWTPTCPTCKGTCIAKSGDPCKKCLGRGVMVMRPHLHGMLLMGKRLLRELWTEWVFQVDGIEPEPWTGG